MEHQLNLTNLPCIIQSVHVLLSVLAIIIAPHATSSNNLSIVLETYPPYTFEENGQLIGIETDIARHIFSKLVIPVKFIILPWKRAWAMLKTGDADVGMAISKKQQRWNYVYYPQQPVWHASFVFFTHQQTFATLKIQGLHDAKSNNLIIGVIDGHSYDKPFWKVYPYKNKSKKQYHPHLRPVTTIEQAFNMLYLKRISLFPIVKDIGNYTIKQMGLSDITFYDTVLFSKPYFTVFSKKSTFKNSKYNSITEVLAAYDKELAVFKQSNTFKLIFKKYTQ